jgi:hypothetical protein
MTDKTDTGSKTKSKSKEKPQSSDKNTTSTESTTALVPIDEAPITFKTVKMLADSPTIPTHLAGHPQDIVATILNGRELGLAPMESINNLYMVNGKISLSGKTMLGLIRKAGHRVMLDIKLTGTTIECYRLQPDGSQFLEGSVGFNQADVKRAKMSKKDTYIEYPQMMMAWRAVSMAARFFYSDCITAVSYTPEEVGMEEFAADEMEMDAIEANVITILDGELMTDGGEYE